MTSRELSKLNRNELLEMLLEQIRENERLQAELQEATAQLEKREIAIANSGTLAEAALRVSGIFEAADNAVQVYTDNLARYTEGKQRDYDLVIADAKARAAELIRWAEAKADRIVRSAEEESKAKVAYANAYCGQMAEKLEAVYRSQLALNEAYQRQYRAKNGGNNG